MGHGRLRRRTLSARAARMDGARDGAKPVRQRLWYALGVRMGFDPAGLRRLEASLAPSPPLVDQTGAAPADAAAPAAPVQAPAASAPPWFSEADMFAPRLPDPSAYLAPPRTPLPTWDTVAPAAPAAPTSPLRFDDLFPPPETMAPRSVDPSRYRVPPPDALEATWADAVPP